MLMVISKMQDMKAVGSLMAASLLLAACSGSASQAPALDHRAGLSCVDDSPRCVKARVATMKSLSSGSDRSWIKEKPGPKAYATGVRLFALKNRRASLTCDELAHGRREAKGARRVLRQPGSGLSPAQISRATMLATEVQRDLDREMKRRCSRRG